jgi:hypothetical protein
MLLVRWGVIVVKSGLLAGRSPTSRAADPLMAFDYHLASIGGWLA